MERLKTSKEFNQIVALVQACTFGAFGVWSAYVMPDDGTFTLGNGRLVVGSVFLVFAIMWFAAFLWYRRAANKGKRKDKQRDWSA